jgi:hypothetical protein
VVAISILPHVIDDGSSGMIDKVYQAWRSRNRTMWAIMRLRLQGPAIGDMGAKGLIGGMRLRSCVVLAGEIDVVLKDGCSVPGGI